MINLLFIKFENTVGRDALTHTWVARRREVWYSTRQHSKTGSFKNIIVWTTYRNTPFAKRQTAGHPSMGVGIPPYRLSTDSGIELISVYLSLT